MGKENPVFQVPRDFFFMLQRQQVVIHSETVEKSQTFLRNGIYHSLVGSYFSIKKKKR